MSERFELDETTGGSSSCPAVILNLLPLFLPHLRTLGLAAALLGATTAAQLAGPLLIRRAIDVDIRGGSFTGLLGTVGGYVGVQALLLALDYLKKIRLETMGQEIILRLRRRLFGSLLSQSLSFYDRNPAGRLISRVQGDTDALRQMFASTVVTLIEAIVLFAGMLAVMATVSFPLALVVAGMIPVMVTTAWFLARGGGRRFREVRRRSAEISAFIAERVSGMSLIQAYGREKASLAELGELNRSKFRAALRAEYFEMALFHGIFYLETAGLALILWLGGRWAIAGSLSIGTLFMFIEYLRRLFDPVMRLSEQLDVMQRAVAAAGRVFALLDLAPEVTDPPSPARWEGLEREIEFRDVWFSYRGDGEWALQDISFTIRRGETWAIVGATGGGKSSILNLLLRFYDPQRGAVLVDGRDVRTLAQRELRRRMALVLQDVFLFPGDVHSNIAPRGGGHDGADEEARVQRAARIAGADGFIDRLAEGYRTPVAERGANLSSGQRQLLSLARALAADPEALLLDEATAAVDPETEAQVQRALKTLLTGRTAVVIAHRLSTVREADGILVVAGGRIVERGRHEELLARGGVYADLHALQFQQADSGLAEGPE